MALVAAVGLLYGAYVSPRLVSGNDERDALAYLATVVDACAQARAGTFPIYVGQSVWRFDGGLYPQAQAPYLTLVAPLLDLLTLRRLAGPQLVNLLAFTHALAGALVSLGLLRRVAPGHPWTMAALAFGYVACPGVMGVLVRLDMLTTLLTLPLLPLLWDALAGLLEERPASRTWRSGVQLALAVAGLWSAHAPVALWATSLALVVALVGLTLARARWRTLGRALLLAAGLFALVMAWPLATILTLTGGRAGNVGLGASGVRLSPDLVARTLANLRGDAVGALLPLGFVRGHPQNGWPYAEDARLALPVGWRAHAIVPYLQLGWLLWAALLWGLFESWRAPTPALAALMAGALVLLLFLYPLPGLGTWAWAALPGLFDITKIWPMQRFYVLLASLAVAIGARAWVRVPAASRGLRIALCLLVPWSAYQAARLGVFAWQQQAADDGLEYPENVPLRLKDLQMGTPVAWPEWSDARLHLALLDARGQPVAEALEVARAGCTDATPLETVPGDETIAVLTLRAEDPRLVCLHSAPAGLLEAYGHGFYRQRRTHARGATADDTIDEVFPLWISRAEPQRIALRFTDAAGQRLALSAPRFMLGRYDPTTLPIVVERWLPLRLWVPAAQAGLRLETARRFMPGQTAFVNARQVDLERSSRGRLAVPLQPGSNRVELAFHAPQVLRLTWPVSVAALTLALAALARGRGAERKPAP